MKIFKEADKTYLIGILIYIISLGVYIHTLAPSITFEDSGELITSPYILGISHPPGYPLYNVIMKVMFSLLPVGNIAFRANFATAIWGSLSVLMVYLIVLKVERNLIEEGKASSEVSLNGYVPAVLAAFMTSFSGMIWLHSVTTEVYTLNLFFMMLLTYFMLIWESKRDIRYVFLVSLIYGLSFGNHIQAVLFLPAFIYFFLITDWREILKIKYLIYMILLFCSGLIIYVYLPLRSAQNPYLDWSNPESWEGFLFAIKREQYREFESFRDIKKLVQQLNLFGFFEQVGIWSFFFSFFGLYRLIRKNLKIFITFSLITFCSGIGFVCIVNPFVPKKIFALIRAFYLPMYAVFAIWISFGIVFVLEKIYSYLEQIKPVSSKVRAFILLPFLILPSTMLIDHYKLYDFKRNYFAYDYAVNMANSAEEKSVLFTSLVSDTFPLWYYKYCEGRRSDLVVVHQILLAVSPWYYAQMMQDEPKLVLAEKEFSGLNNTDDFYNRSRIIAKYIIINNPGYKYYYTNFSKNSLPENKPPKVKGILWQDTSESTDFINEKIWLNYYYRSLGKNKSIRLIKDDEILLQLYRFNLKMASKYLEEEKVDLAIYQYQLANKTYPDPDVYYHLGFIYIQKNMFNSAIRDYKEFLKLEHNSSRAQGVREWLKQNEKFYEKI